MRTLLAAASLAVSLGPLALAQEAGEDDLVEGEGGVGGAVGLATGAAADTFFIAEPLEYHLLATELPGREIYLDATDTGMQQRVTPAPEVATSADSGVLEGEQPLGTITDLIIDRRGGTAGLVLELTPDVRGGGREIAVAMGLVRMLPDPEDPATTHILLSVDPVDLQNAPTFERSEAPGAAQGAEAEQQAAEGEPTEGAQQPADGGAGAQ